MASHSLLNVAVNASISTSDPLVRLTKAVGDPLRLEVLRLLRQDSFGVLELCKITDTPQSGMKPSLRILSDANLVERGKKEPRSFIGEPRRPHATLEPLTHTLFQTIDQMPLSLKNQTRKEAVHGDVVVVQRHSSKRTMNNLKTTKNSLPISPNTAVSFRSPPV